MRLLSTSASDKSARGSQQPSSSSSHPDERKSAKSLATKDLGDVVSQDVDQAPWIPCAEGSEALSSNHAHVPFVGPSRHARCQLAKAVEGGHCDAQIFFIGLPIS